MIKGIFFLGPRNNPTIFAINIGEFQRLRNPRSSTIVESLAKVQTRSEAAVRCVGLSNLKAFICNSREFWEKISQSRL